MLLGKDWILSAFFNVFLNVFILPFYFFCGLLKGYLLSDTLNFSQSFGTSGSSDSRGDDKRGRSIIVKIMWSLPLPGVAAGYVSGYLS